MNNSKILFTLAISLFITACGKPKEEDAKSRGAGGCGTINAKVYGGESCKDTARTPVVKLIITMRDGRMSTCSGALVTVNDILTSAHCFRRKPEEVVALVGGEKGEWISVSKIAIHPSFKDQVGDPYDLAMATLNKLPNPLIGPLPILEKKKVKEGDGATAFGYGLNEEKDPYQLKSTDVKIEDKMGGNIFAMDKTSNGSICGGDSGGPLTYLADDKVASLIGVNSFGDALSDCQNEGSRFSGFVDLQRKDVMKFIQSYAPDAATY
jgi:V8-like Glu-specific endopeptidase